MTARGWSWTRATVRVDSQITQGRGLRLGLRLERRAAALADRGGHAAAVSTRLFTAAALFNRGVRVLARSPLERISSISDATSRPSRLKGRPPAHTLESQPLEKGPASHRPSTETATITARTPAVSGPADRGTYQGRPRCACSSCARTRPRGSRPKPPAERSRCQRPSRRQQPRQTMTRALQPRRPL